jgi:hypothetical protein
MAAQDAKKEARAKFIQPERKTGVPSAKPAAAPAKKTAKKAVGRPKKA